MAKMQNNPRIERLFFFQWTSDSDSLKERKQNATTLMTPY
jgi:hypothetical protein